MNVKSLQELLDRWVKDGKIKPTDEITFGDKDESADYILYNDNKVSIKSDWF